MLDPLGDLLVGVYGTEAQGIDKSDGLRAHAYDVPEDASDTGGGASVGLDSGRVVVALDPEGVSVVVIEHHHSGISPGEDVGMVDGEDELLEDVLGALVAAVLAPCLAEGLQLDVGGIPPLLPEVIGDDLHLVEGQTEAEVGGELLQLVVGGREYVDVVERERDIAFDHKPVSGHVFISR